MEIKSYMHTIYMMGKQKRTYGIFPKMQNH